MKTYDRDSQSPPKSSRNNRREFINRGIFLGALTGVAGLGLITGCKNETDEGVSPAEDLMREHGVLNRILLIYDTCRLHLVNNEQFDEDVLSNSAQMIRTFIEDYHEKLEEDFLFPRFEKANKLTDLVQVLRKQHKAGRILTDLILQFGAVKSPANTDRAQNLIKLINDFNVMYRPHEAREDTVLFPALRKIVSENEYFAMGENFEDREHELFGKDGFETIVEKVADIEKQLGIYDLSMFTPTWSGQFDTADRGQ
jgi:hemerythrin-like domain-containing protein